MYWSPDLCSADLAHFESRQEKRAQPTTWTPADGGPFIWPCLPASPQIPAASDRPYPFAPYDAKGRASPRHDGSWPERGTNKRSGCTSGATACADVRSEEHTSELQSPMRISYAVFCLKKKK